MAVITCKSVSELLFGRKCAAADEEVDFACGGTDTEPQAPEHDAMMMAMDNFIYCILVPALREQNDDRLYAEMFGAPSDQMLAEMFVDPASASDLLAITRSIARGS